MTRVAAVVAPLNPEAREAVRSGVENAVARARADVPAERFDDVLIRALDERVRRLSAEPRTPSHILDVERAKVRLSVYAYLVSEPPPGDALDQSAAQRDAAVEAGREILGGILPEVPALEIEEALNEFRKALAALENSLFEPSFFWPISDAQHDLLLDTWRAGADGLDSDDLKETFRLYELDTRYAPQSEVMAVKKRRAAMLASILWRYGELRRYICPEPISFLQPEYDRFRASVAAVADRQSEANRSNYSGEMYRRDWSSELRAYETIQALYETIHPSLFLDARPVAFALTAAKVGINIAPNPLVAMPQDAERYMEGLMLPTAEGGMRIEIISRSPMWRTRSILFESLGTAIAYNGNWAVYFPGVGQFDVYDPRGGPVYRREPVGVLGAPKDHRLKMEAYFRLIGDAKRTTRVAGWGEQRIVAESLWPQDAAWLYFAEIRRAVHTLSRPHGEWMLSVDLYAYDDDRNEPCATAVWRLLADGEQAEMRVDPWALVEPKYRQREGDWAIADSRVWRWRFPHSGTLPRFTRRTPLSFQIATERGEVVVESIVSPSGQTGNAAVPADLLQPIAKEYFHDTARSAYYQLLQIVNRELSNGGKITLDRRRELAGQLDAIASRAVQEGDEEALAAILHSRSDYVRDRGGSGEWREVAERLLSNVAENADEKQMWLTVSAMVNSARQANDVDGLLLVFDLSKRYFSERVDADELVSQAKGYLFANEAVISAIVFEAVCEKVVVGDPLEREARKKLVDAYDLWHRQQCEGASPHAELCAFIAEKRNNAASAWAAGSIASPSSGG